jgi:hypothetical protein
MKNRIEEDPGFLKIGLQGIPSMDLNKTFQELLGMEKEAEGDSHIAVT